MEHKAGNLLDDIDDLVKGHVLLIPHICNNFRLWKTKFVLALGRRFPEAVYAFYKKKSELGTVQFVEDENMPITICNMFAEESSGLNCLALEKCMEEVRDRAFDLMDQRKKVRILCPCFKHDRCEYFLNRCWRYFDLKIYD